MHIVAIDLITSEGKHVPLSVFTILALVDSKPVSDSWRVGVLVHFHVAHIGVVSWVCIITVILSTVSVSVSNKRLGKMLR